MLMAFALVSACDSAGDPPVDRARQVETVGGFELLSLPADPRRECRRLAAAARGIRCPATFPRPSEASGGKWLIKPMKHGFGADAPKVGIEINYFPEGSGRSAEPGVIHFWITLVPDDVPLARYGGQLPEEARPATLGGRDGTYAPPTGPAPCCNHAVFVWTEADRRYAASLHMMGPATRQLLDVVLDQRT
jgi:hypothetical protein